MKLSKNLNTTINLKPLAMKILNNKILFSSALIALGISNTDAQTTSENYISSTDCKSTNCNEKVQTVVYFDGLGREISTVTKATNTNNSTTIATKNEYDAFGRISKEFLPGVVTNNSLQLPTSISYAEYPNTSVPYSEKKYENSPLSRVLKQAAPGENWSINSDHTIEFKYQTNTEADKVLRFDISFNNGKPTIIPNATYAKGSLYKTVTIDENKQPIQKFKDKEGKVILKRISIQASGSNSSGNHDTYYVYDIYGNLTFVLPPLLVKNGNYAGNLNELGYQYVYDDKNRLVEKKLPGKGWEYMVYDNQDRLVATQDAVQRPKNEWLFTKYDKFGRVAITGLIWNNKNRSDLQNYVKTLGNNNVERDATGYDQDLIKIYYNSNGFGAKDHVLTVAYYDTYPLTASTNPGSVYNKNIATNLLTKGLPTHSISREIGTWNFAFNTMYYDSKYLQPVYTYNKNHLNGYDEISNNIDFSGKVLETTRIHQPKAGALSVQTIEMFTYDEFDRILNHTHQVNNGKVEYLAQNKYNKIGQLTNKKVGNTANDPLQNVNYKYNIRGWLTDINDIDGIVNLGKGGQLFNFKISYDTKISRSNRVSEGLYNGNISQTFWKTGSDPLRSYDYVYDGLNRLTHAQFYKGKDESLKGYYDEKLDYDANGNITKLQRYGLTEYQTPILIDDLTYQYAINNVSNKLTSVTDAIPNMSESGFIDGNKSGNDYDYDANGNLIKDLNKGITNITYNFLNLPVEVIWNNTKKIKYDYDASGIKIRKIVTNANTVTTTEYLGGFQYVNNNLQFFPTSEGYVNVITCETCINLRTYSYVYNYTDHLGNVRLSYAWDDTVNKLKLIESSHYYPFGMKHEGYYSFGSIDNGGIGQVNNIITGTDTYNYKYNGKELQNEFDINLYDYGARNYDPAIGRWMNIDPLAEKFNNLTPYSYVANNPLIYVDPDGRDIKLASEVVDGKTTITVTVTGKLINESGKAYTAEQMQAYTDRLVSSISSAYTGSDGDVSWKGVANITLVSDDNPLGATDHAFRIVDQGKIPGAEGENGVLGMAPFGENVVYLSNHILDRTQATEGTYSGTGKTDAGTGTLERTGPHELGHSGNLKHPTPGTMDGNLMHQTKQPNAGMKLTKDQILQMLKDYDAGKLNQGKQKVE